MLLLFVKAMDVIFLACEDLESAINVGDRDW